MTTPNKRHPQDRGDLPDRLSGEEHALILACRGLMERMRASEMLGQDDPLSRLNTKAYNEAYDAIGLAIDNANQRVDP